MKFYSQNGQDQILFNTFFKNMIDRGTFLEIGADDGIDKSNSLFFEESLGWEGICVEPRPQAFSKLVGNRTCICENVAISSNCGTSQFLSITGYGKGLSGLVDSYDSRHKERINRELKLPCAKDSQAETIEVEVVSIEKLLDKHSISHIDFCSIDTEGSELSIIQSIDFSKYHFNVFLIENNYQDETVRAFLEDLGFIFYGTIGADDVYVNRRFKAISKNNSSIKKSLDGIPIFRFHSAQNNQLYVFLTGIPNIENLYNTRFFEWKGFASKHLYDANCLFLRDPHNSWYLHSSDGFQKREKAVELIESFRQYINIGKSNVTLAGVSAGGTAALDIAAGNGYGRGVSFSAQVDLHKDNELLEYHGETWRPRFLLEQKVINNVPYSDLCKTLLNTPKETSLHLVWGHSNTIDNKQHIELSESLSGKNNIHFYSIETASHNSTSELCYEDIQSLLNGNGLKQQLACNSSKPLRLHGTTANTSLDATMRPVADIIESTPANYKWSSDADQIRSHLSNERNLCLISFPRTGSHWLRMLMELYFDRPLLTRSFFEHTDDHFLLLHDHDLSLNFQAKNIIYLYRDPVDTIYSQLNYHRENTNDRKRIAYWADLYSAHISKWIYKASFADHKLVLRYEDLKDNPVRVIERLANFIKVPFDIKRAKETIALVTKNLVKTKTIGHDPKVQKVSSSYENQRKAFRKKHADYIWNEVFSKSIHTGIAFGQLPSEKQIDSLLNTSTKPRRLKSNSKIVGLVAVRNEENLIGQCLKALSRFTDAIIVLDDASEDHTVQVIETLRVSCNIEKVLRKDTWYRDEPGDRNRLLEAGRAVGGTHFISLDADEMFTANFQKDSTLKKKILSLRPGDCLALVWICLWRSVLQYRYDNSVWTNNYKAFVFADDGISRYQSDFIHTGRIPNGLKGKIRKLDGYDQGVLHFQFVNWRNLLIKQAWYRCLERIRIPSKSVTEINRRYSASKNEVGLNLRPAMLKWFVGYEFLDENCFLKSDHWRVKQIREWFQHFGRDYFRDLDIWDIDWDDTTQSLPVSDAPANGSSKPSFHPGQIPDNTKNHLLHSMAEHIERLKKQPKNPDLLYNIGSICLELNRPNDALDFFHSAICSNANHKPARDAIARFQQNSTITSPISISNKSITVSGQPLITAIVSVYNAERFINGCLEDLLRQTLADKLEIIVIDSGSQQNESAIVRQLQKKHPQIRYIRTDERETVYAAWNRGIKASRGKYITNANCDDRHRPDAFEIMVHTLEKMPDISLVYADCLITETENETFEACTPVGAFRWMNWNRDHLLFKGCFMGPQPMWRRSLHDEYGYFDPEYVTSGDYEFWLRISQTHNFYHICEYLGLYLRSSQSIEHRNRDKQTLENKRLLNMYRKALSQNKIIRKMTSLNAATDEKSVAIAPTNKAILLFEGENYGEAATYLNQLLSDHPDHWEAYELLVDVMLQTGQEKDIHSRLQLLEKRSNLPPRMMALVGSGYEASGNLQKASAFIDKALTIDSECARALNLKGIVAYRKGQFSEAAQAFQKASECDHEWGDPWTNMGMLHWEQGTHDKALECFKTGFQLSPTAPNVATTYHMAISETLQYETAREVFEDAVSRHPAFRKGRFLLIDVLIRLEAYQEALDQIEAVLVRFGADTQLLKAAKAVRAKVCPLTINKNKHSSLSLCMIVKNEEKYLARCLASLKPIVDEMIVVDTGSTDATRDIAEVFGAQVSDFEWNDDFSAARNFSLDQAQGDWILVMDADEVIAAKDHPALMGLVAQDVPDTSQAYMLTTRNYTARKNTADWTPNKGDYTEEASTGWTPSRKVRLFRNRQGIHFVFPVHEQVDPVLEKKGVNLIDCPIPVHHYGKLDSHRTSERWQMYYKIGEKKLEALGNDQHALKELAIQAGLLSRWDKAATYWQQYLKRAPNSLDACMNLTRVMAKSGDFKQANAYARKAVELSSGRSEPLYNLALSELQLGRANDAVKTVVRMLQAFPDDSDGNILRAIAEICAGNETSGIEQYHKLTKQIPIDSILARTLSILSSMRSAGLEDWMVTAVQAIGAIKGLQDIGAAVVTPSVGSPHAHNGKRVPNDSATVTCFSKAVQCYEKEDYSSALSGLEALLADDPNNWEAYELLVDILLQSGQEAIISEKLRPLEKRSGLPARIMALMGCAYETDGDFSQAAYFADRALEMARDCARAWNLKGVIAYRNGQSSDAARFFQKASECDSEWGDPWTNMGILHWENGTHDTALACFEKGFQLSPTAPNVATSYHMAISETGQYDGAKALFEKAVKQHPDFRKARFLLIDILIRLEVYPSALDQIEAVLVRFGVDPQLLEAAKTVRAKKGLLSIQKGKHPSLSLCMIVKNEEKYLARCLECLQPIVDEMIIVDTGSTDTTRDIAEVFGARVFDFEWNDDFSAARNFSLDQAQGDWILVMDADEVIAAKDHAKIRKLLEQTRGKNRAFTIVTRNYTHQYNIIGWESNTGQYPDEEAGVGWVPSEKVRLFPNISGIRFEYPVHEVVGPSLGRKNIAIKSCPCPVHHYGKMDEALNQVKGEQYFNIGMAKLSDSQDNPVAIRELAVQAAKLGKHRDSIMLWKRLIKHQPNDARSFVNLSSNHGKLQQYHEARKAAQKAIKLSPNLKEGHLNLGRSELFLGNFAKAETIFKKLFKKNKRYYQALFLLGATQFCRGQFDEGVETFQSLRNVEIIWSNLSYSLQELIEGLLAAGMPEVSRNLMMGAENLNCSNDGIKGLKRQLDAKAA